jgi:hypothetical protein
MKVFVTCPLPGDAIDRLKQTCDVTVGEPGLGVRSESFANEAGTFEVILALLTDAIDEPLLDRTPRVRLVAVTRAASPSRTHPACSRRPPRTSRSR